MIDLASLYLARNAESRSISAENPDGRRGGGGRATSETSLHPKTPNHARELGPGWKLSPCVEIQPGDTVRIADIEGPGVIRHIWMTLDATFHRDVVLRITWDDQEHPSVECPIGDFFCNSWNGRQNILAVPINVNPDGGLNAYFPMPFVTRCRIEVENQSPERLPALFYTVNYTLEDVPNDALRFCASWRRENPTLYKRPFTLLEGVAGRGHFVGTFVSWQQNNAGWWGEGEIKMYIDDDDEYPTICGTGTEDYFGGAWCFGENFSAPFLGYQKVLGEDVGSRMTMYRFHVHDPVYFKERLRVTLQALGWRSEKRYLPLQDDISAVAYWYQDLPSRPFEELAGRNAREIV